jgi:hypothetical protein
MNRIKTVNQYFIYGILVPLASQDKWDISGNEDISCLFNTRDGECVIIGKILHQTTDESPLLGYNKPFPIGDLKMDAIDEKIVEDNVGRKFGVAGAFHYYFVTHSR